MNGEVIELDVWKDRRTLEEVLLSAAYHRGRMDTLEQTPEKKHGDLAVLLEVWRYVRPDNLQLIPLQRDLAWVLFGDAAESGQEQ